MDHVLITGTPGTGKTEIIGALRELGERSLDLDNFAPAAVRLEDRRTRMPVEWPEEGAVDWDVVAWNIQSPGLTYLLDADRRTFIGVSASNQADYYHRFAHKIALWVDDVTLEKQLRQRDAHPHGQTEADIERYVKINHDRKYAYQRDGLTLVENLGQPETVAQRILRLCFDN